VLNQMSQSKYYSFGVTGSLEININIPSQTVYVEYMMTTVIKQIVIQKWHLHTKLKVNNR